MCDSPSVTVPAQDPAQQALEAQQADALKQQTTILQSQYSMQQMLAPYLYQSMGLTPSFGADGKISGFTQDPSVQQNRDLQNSVNTSLLQRTQDALAGNLPVDPALERGISEGQTTLNDTLLKNLGPGYATSTPGLQAQANYGQRAEELRYNARNGQLSLSDQLALAGQTGLTNNSNSIAGGINSIGQAPLQTAGAFGNLIQGYGTAVQPYVAAQQLGTQASIAKAQINSQDFQAMLGLAGSALGAVAGAVAA